MNEAPTCVLDTQFVLDWVVFDDPRMRAWTAAITAGRLRWILCDAMRDEALRVLHYPAIARRMAPEQSRPLLTACFERHAIPVAMPSTAPTAPRCTDPDDQVFLDLALARKASWLLSRDQALLRLRARAAKLGLHIGTPDQLTPPA